MKHIRLFEEHTEHFDLDLLKSQLFDKVFEYYDEDDDDYLSDSDQWLKKYTYQALDKWPSDDIVDDLLHSYPNKQTSVLYRGMNFDTKEEYEKFKKDITDGTLSTGSITSWGGTRSTAWQFAVTRPTYFMDLELMQTDSKRKSDKEYMLGYVGVILKTTVDAGKAIDVNQSDYAKENEMILPPGEYKIEIEEVKPFREMVKEEDPDKVITSLTEKDIKEDSFNAKFFKYIMFHGVDLSDRAKKHIFNLMSPKGSPVVDIKNTKSPWREDNHIDTQIWVYYPDSNSDGRELYMYAPMLGPKYEKMLGKMADEQLTALITAVNNNKDFEKGLIRGNVGEMMNYYQKYASDDLLAKYKNSVRGRLAQEYRKLSSDDVVFTKTVKDINKIKDPDEKRKAIDNYGKDIVRSLQNMLNLA